MARDRVGDLWVHIHGGDARGALVPIATVERPPAKRGGADLVRWAHSIQLPWGTMVAGGLGLVVAGLGMAMFALGPIGTLVTSTMLTAGAGLSVLGAVKRIRRRPAEPRALSAAEDRVLRERSRRIRSLLEGGTGEFTFERIVKELRWTDEAVLSALLHMKDSGEIIEDLNLDSGEWVYRVQDADHAGEGRPLMLEERKELGP